MGAWVGVCEWVDIGECNGRRTTVQTTPVSFLVKVSRACQTHTSAVL